MPLKQFILRENQNVRRIPWRRKNGNILEILFIKFPTKEELKTQIEKVRTELNDCFLENGKAENILEISIKLDGLIESYLQVAEQK